MEKKTPLENSVEKVLEELRKAGYCQSSILIINRAYNRLLKSAAIMQTDTFNDALADYFVNDSANVKTGLYCHLRKRLHSSCIRKLRECEEKGYVGWKPWAESKVDKPVTIVFQNIHVEFLEHLKAERKSQNTVDSYRNISCKFLVFIERLGYTDLKTVPLKLIHEFFLDLRGTWDSGSLPTAASGLRSFLNFAEGGTKLLSEVPDKLLRKRAIIPVLTQEEEQSVWDVLKTDAVSSRDKAIMVLSLLTGLRAVDIVNLKWLDRPFTTQDVVRTHENAFRYFGGKPKEMVYDQDHLILVHENYGDLIFTQEFAVYVKRRNFQVHMCRKADPESKGMIENVVGFVKKNFARHRIFYSLDKLNEACLA